MMKESVNKLYLFTKTFRNLWLRERRTDFGNYSIVKPGQVSPQKQVPNYIPKPSYYASGIPTAGPDSPERKNEAQIRKMRNSCRLAANILKYVGSVIHVGQTTDEIDNIVHNLSIINGAYPSPLNYNKFPKSVCTSVNNVACHGIPDNRSLEDGDIINVDVTVFYDGFHGDCSTTFKVGNVDEQGTRLVEATKNCLNMAISLCKPGEKFQIIGACTESFAEEMGYAVVPIFAGHGIGEYFHGPPDVIHISNDYLYEMDVGMTFTIEPVLSQGTWQVIILKDNWTAVTIDDSRSAQFEHTILITETGAEILTEADDTDICKGFKYDDLKGKSFCDNLEKDDV